MKLRMMIATMLIAVLMLSCMSVAAYAAMEGELTGGRIVISDAVPGQTYNAYQLMYLEGYDESADAYAYKANSAWASWLADQTDYLKIDEQGYITWVEGADAEDFAIEAQKQAVSMSADASATADSANVTMSGLKLGYYLVDTSLGALCSLNTTDDIAVIEEKNVQPTLEKTVQEDSTGEYGAYNDAQIGEEVNFEIVIKAYKGAVNYVLRDKMDGLALDATSISVEGLTKDQDYTVECERSAFEMTFTKDFLDTVTGTAEAPTLITLRYSAVVLPEATIAGAGNDNTAYLLFGDKYSDSEDSSTTTYVWGLEVLKYGDGQKDNTLEGAKFALLNSEQNKVATILNDKVVSWTTVAADADLTAYAVTTDGNGAISIEGLDSETYYLVEVEAPAGYNLLEEPFEIAVAAGTVSDTGLNYTPAVAEINNQSGARLPETGGSGTTAYYVLGLLMMLSAAIFLAGKKRYSAN